MEDPFNKAIEQAKAELKARYLTEKVAMRAMQIYYESKKENEK